MVARQPVCVLYNTLFANVYEDGLTTHSTDVVREVLGWHPRRTVILKKQQQRSRIKKQKRKGTQRMCKRLLTPTVEAMKSAHISAKSLPRTP